MGFSLDVSVPVLTVFLQGLLSFFLTLCTAADTFVYQLFVRRNTDSRKRWKNIF